MDLFERLTMKPERWALLIRTIPLLHMIVGLTVIFTERGLLLRLPRWVLPAKNTLLA